MHNVRGSGLMEDGGETAERQVDTDDNADTLTSQHRVDLSTQDGGAYSQKHRPAVQRKALQAAAVILTLWLVVGITVIIRFNLSILWEKYLLSKRYEKLQNSYDNLRNSHQLKETESHAEGNSTRWKRFRCSCYYKSSEMKSWMDSRRDCQSKGADLLIINSKDEQEFVSELSQHGASWIGLQAVKSDGWQEDVEWRWVDGSKPTYMAWHVGTNIRPVDGSRGYIGQQGTFQHTTSGSKHWICEKKSTAT
uniref:natural killer cells antigen CD94-like n=1 Tax=Scatophagus argus TaxID=75038 RepID=UPI001ED7E8E7|nr:natural killer cells antigen CD94-like [Scatophagus argus]